MDKVEAEQSVAQLVMVGARRRGFVIGLSRKIAASEGLQQSGTAGKRNGTARDIEW